MNIVNRNNKNLQQKEKQTSGFWHRHAL